MPKASTPRLAYEAPTAEVIKLGTEDILTASTTIIGEYEYDDLGAF